MINTDKVLIGLGQHISGRTPERCECCPYFIVGSGYGVSCRDELLDDLYEMLEAQEQEVVNLTTKIVELTTAQDARVMTPDELQECVTYWVEDETGHVVPETIMDISGKNIMTIPVVHLTNGYAPIITKTTDGYNTKRFTGWRCWTSRPTDAQKEAVKWE